MSKSSKRSKRSRGTADRLATTDVVTQLECAIRRPQATLIGALVGGLVPWFARTLAHVEVPATWSGGSRGLALVMLAVVLGAHRLQVRARDLRRRAQGARLRARDRGRDRRARALDVAHVAHGSRRLREEHDTRQ